VDLSWKKHRALKLFGGRVNIASIRRTGTAAANDDVSGIFSRRVKKERYTVAN
jgi:hypothetical protein